MDYSSQQGDATYWSIMAVQGLVMPSVRINFRYYLLVLGVLTLGLTVVHGGCPGALELMGKSDGCLQRLGGPTNSTLVGGLTTETYQDVCGIYTKSVNCVRNLVKHCSEDNEDAAYAKHIIEALEQGLGKLCLDDRTFQRYLKYASCYRDHRASTGLCMNEFSTEVRRITSVDFEEYQAYSDDDDDLYAPEAELEEEQDPDKVMCRTFLTLMSCVRDVIKVNCGADASGLFKNLVKAHVPTSVCETEVEDPDQNNVNKVQPRGVLLTCAIIMVPLVNHLFQYTTN